MESDIDQIYISLINPQANTNIILSHCVYKLGYKV